MQEAAQEMNDTKQKLKYMMYRNYLGFIVIQTVFYFIVVCPLYVFGCFIIVDDSGVNILNFINYHLLCPSLCLVNLVGFARQFLWNKKIESIKLLLATIVIVCFMFDIHLLGNLSFLHDGSFQRIISSNQWAIDIILYSLTVLAFCYFVFSIHKKSVFNFNQNKCKNPVLYTMIYTVLFFGLWYALFMFNISMQGNHTVYGPVLSDEKEADIMLLIVGGVLLTTIASWYSWLVFYFVRKGIKP